MKPTETQTSRPQADSRLKNRIVAVIAVLILVPAAYGFIDKIYAFISVAEGAHDELRFTIVPVLNYFLLAAGFFCLLIWATLQGMFRNIERPKYTMLEREAELQRREDELNRHPHAPCT